MSMQHKDKHYFSGAITTIKAETVRTYPQNGEMREWRERTIYVTNKHIEYGKWQVTTLPFSCGGKVLEQLETIALNTHVIVYYKHRSKEYKDKNGETKFWVTFVPILVMSPKDQIATEKWLSYQDGQPNREPKPYQSERNLTEQDYIQKHPGNKDYGVADNELGFGNKKETKGGDPF